MKNSFFSEDEKLTCSSATAGARVSCANSHEDRILSKVARVTSLALLWQLQLDWQRRKQ
jgi:hypothetical protein